MIAALHAAGIGVIMDVVYNHMYRYENVLNNTVPVSYTHLDVYKRQAIALAPPCRVAGKGGKGRALCGGVQGAMADDLLFLIEGKARCRAAQFHAAVSSFLQVFLLLQ